MAHAKNRSAIGKPTTIKADDQSHESSFGTSKTGKTCAIPCAKRPGGDDVSDRDPCTRCDRFISPKKVFGFIYLVVCPQRERESKGLAGSARFPHYRHRR